MLGKKIMQVKQILLASRFTNHWLTGIICKIFPTFISLQHMLWSSTPHFQYTTNNNVNVDIKNKWAQKRWFKFVASRFAPSIKHFVKPHFVRRSRTLGKLTQALWSAYVLCSKQVNIILLSLDLPLLFCCLWKF